jgi:hypothetical protein
MVTLTRLRIATVLFGIGLLVVAVLIGRDKPAVPPLILPAWAQNTICPTAPPGTSDDRCASTAFVQQAIGGTGSLPPLLFNDVWVGNNLNTAAGQLLPNCTAALTYNNVTQAFGCNTGLGTGSVTSITIAPGNGILATGTCTITTTGTCTIADDIATNANIWAGTANKILDATGVQTALAPQAITPSGSTFTPALGSGINFSITLLTSSCTCTIANPTGVFAGASFFLDIIQPASGGPATVTTWGSSYKFPGGTPPTLSTAANADDMVPVYCRATNFCEVGPINLAFQ